MLLKQRYREMRRNCLIKKILLVDVDSNMPNLALMKLSSYYKSLGFEIKLIQMNISFYPTRIKSKTLNIDEKYDKVFISVIFTTSLSKLKINNPLNNNISYGGTGYDINIKLLNDIEKCEPDYSIYPDCDYSIGFITRGCIRNCSFCFVPKKEGRLYFNQHPREIIRHKKVKFLDNNFLAYKAHEEILK